VDNYYKLLNVKKDASQSDIKLAYRVLASKFHPDKYPENTKFAEDMMKRLNVAFEVLSDPIKRKAYDEWLTLNDGSNTQGSSREKAKPSESHKNQNYNSPDHVHLYLIAILGIVFSLVSIIFQLIGRAVNVLIEILVICCRNLNKIKNNIGRKIQKALKDILKYVLGFLIFILVLSFIAVILEPKTENKIVNQVSTEKIDIAKDVEDPYLKFAPPPSQDDQISIKNTPLVKQIETKIESEQPYNAAQANDNTNELPPLKSYFMDTLPSAWEYVGFYSENKVKAYVNKSSLRQIDGIKTYIVKLERYDAPTLLLRSYVDCNKKLMRITQNVKSIRSPHEALTCSSNCFDSGMEVEDQPGLWSSIPAESVDSEIYSYACIRN
jgi:hypothetical protein